MPPLSGIERKTTAAAQLEAFVLKIPKELPAKESLDDKHVRIMERYDLAVVSGLMTCLARHEGDRVPVDVVGLQADLFGPVPLLQGLVAERFGFVVGYALMQPRYRAQISPRILDVEQLYVHEGSRGLGLGRQLLAAIMALGQREGFTVLAAGKRREGDTGQSFFERIGFTPGADAGLVAQVDRDPVRMPA
jgi:GNAT superfamily N-acetyltransferase